MSKIPEEIIELILSKEVRQLSVEENRLLDEWLDASYVNQKDADELKNLFRGYVKAESYQRIDTKAAWQNIQKRINSEKNTVTRHRSIRIWTAAAAVIIPLFIVVSMMYYFNNQRSFETIKAGTAGAVLELNNGEKINLTNTYTGIVKDSKGTEIGVSEQNTLIYKPDETYKNEKNILTVPLGAEYKLLLSDGTKIIVNSGSKISYPYAFTQSERVVELEGEAYFEVAKDSNRPFFVKTAGVTVKVLGTKFNVCNYRDDAFEHVTLDEGRVQVNRGDSVYKLEPGMQYYLDKLSERDKVARVETELFTSWKNGMFRFQNMTLAQLTMQMHRWYNVQFEFEDSECRDLRFTGAFERTSDFGEFVKIIESTTQVRFKLKGKTILVSKK